MEVATARGFAAAGLLWDVTAFFDSIQIANLIRLCLQRGFMPWVLNLSLQVHTAAGAFKEGPYVSSFIRPTGISILAGCGRSISFTRCALYEILDDLHSSYRPCEIQTYVDDIAQTHTGPKATEIPMWRGSCLQTYSHVLTL